MLYSETNFFKSNLIILFCLNAASCCTSYYLEAIFRIYNNSELFKIWLEFLAIIYSTRKSLPSFFKTNVDDFDY